MAQAQVGAMGLAVASGPRYVALRRRARRRQRGVMVLWVLVTFMVLLGFVGLALDTAYVVLVNQQLQNAADAAALAGARRVMGADNADMGQTWEDQREAEVRTLARNAAAANYAAGSGVVITDADIELGRHYRPDKQQNPQNHAVGFFVGDHPYNAVHVTARRTGDGSTATVPLVFGPMFGVSAASISRDAVAMVNEVQSGIIVLDPTDPSSLNIHGTGGFDFSMDAGVYVNSTAEGATVVSGSGTISAGDLNTVGTTTINGGSTTINVAVNDGSYPVQDPLKDLPEPPLGTTQTQPKDASKPFLPGYYPNGINISSPGNYFFQSGIYVIDKGFSVTSANATVRTNGTLFYIRDGAVKITGGTLKIQPTDQAPWEGLSFWQPASNTKPATITGNSGSWINGTLYFPGAQLSMTGSSQTLTNQIIAWQLDVGGSTAFQIDYQGSNPAPGRVFLVK